MKTEGTHSVFPLGPSTMKIGLDGIPGRVPAGLEGACACPPDGKLEASGSLWMSWAPLKRSIGMPVVVEGQEGVVLLRGEPRLRLEPVAEVRSRPCPAPTP